MEQLVAVTEALPDAFLVVNHRDPVASIQSAVTAQTYAARFWRKTIEYSRIAEYWIDRYARLLRSCVRDRNLLDESRVYDLYFDRLMADPFGELEALYREAGIPFDDQTRAAFEQAIAANKRGKHGQLEYDLRGDFDLDPNEIRERFGFYFERFPEVRVEVE